MSTKVCVKAWNGGPHKTNDAITIGDLAKAMVSLELFGYTEDSPVTLLFDEHHVWLETVEFHEEGGYEPHVEGFRNLRIPRIVERLGDDERDAIWSDCDGDQYRWDGERWEWRQTGLSWTGPSRAWAPAGSSDLDGYAPYTELVDD